MILYILYKVLTNMFKVGTNLHAFPFPIKTGLAMGINLKSRKLLMKELTNLSW